MNALPVLLQAPLFRGLTREELERAIACLGAWEKQFEKGALICRMGSRAPAMGLLVEGRVSLEKLDAWGGGSILALLKPGQLFGETYACLPEEPMTVQVVAAEPCSVLFLKVDKLLAPCSSACTFHQQIIRNLVGLMAEKNLFLNRKIGHIAPRTIRARLLAFLSDEARRRGIREFTIAYNRRQLAEYLAVDRSALSHELAKMEKEGMLRFRQNHFTLLEQVL